MANIALNPRQQPSRIFLSYKRNAEPDESVVRTILNGLLEASHSVFVDRMIKASEMWAERIEREVRQADWLIVFLTESSSHSEMVKGEIEIARNQASTSGGRPRIVPVRLSFEGRLPYPLNAYLDSIQYAMWGGPNDTERLLDELKSVIGGSAIPTSSPLPNASDGECSSIPAYAADLVPPGGVLDVEDPIYIVRKSERKAISLLDHPGQTIVIKGPRQTGKSSLLNRLALAAMRRGRKLALLDLQLFDEGTRKNPQEFFSHALRLICDSLGIQHGLSESFLHERGYTYQCTTLMQDLVLSQLRTPVLLAIDEADRLLATNFRQDFFGMLRHWHELRAKLASREIWRNLDLALVTATEPYLLIDDKDRSPFNVGYVMRLEDFSAAEISELNRLHRSPLTDGGLTRVMELFGGHPYLTRRAFYELASGGPRTSPDELLEQSLEDEGPFRDHLRRHCLNLVRHPQLTSTFLSVLQGVSVVDEVNFDRIEGAGLVKRENGRVVPRCHLYAEYFKRHLQLS